MSLTYRILVLSCLILQLLGSPAHAQSMAVPGAAPATSEPAPDPDAAIGSLLTILKDPLARDELVRRLEVIQQGGPVAAPAGPADPLEETFDLVERRAAVVTDVLLASARALVKLPEAVTWAVGSVSDPRTVGIASEVASRLALVFLVGGALALIAHLILRRHRYRFASAPTGGPLRRTAQAFLRIGIELIPLLLFVASAVAASAFIEMSFHARLVARLIILAIMVARGVAAVRRGTLYPLQGPGRLLPLSDAHARALNDWLRAVVNLCVYGYFGLKAGLVLGMPWELFGLLEHLLFLALTVMLVIMTLRFRQPVCAELVRFRERVGKRGWARILPMRFIAERWHVVVITLIVIHFLVWALHLPDGFRTLLVSTLATVVVLLLVDLGVMLLARAEPERVATTAGAIEEEQGLAPPSEVTAPGVAWRRVLRFALDIVAVAALLVIWVPGLRQWLQGPDSADVLAALLRIAIVIGCIAAVWFVARQRLEAYIAATDNDGNPRHSRRARTVAIIANNALLVALILFGGFFALAQLGVNTAPLLAGAGVVGIAVGFGAQTLVKDVITGLFILLGDTIRVGDVVDLGVKSGGVEAMSMRTITLRDYNGALHNIPYSAISVITNMTKDYAFATFETNVPYTADVDQVMDVLRELDKQLRREWPYRRIILEPIQIDGLDQFGPSSVVVKSRVKVRAGEQWRVMREFNRRLKHRFDELGIDLAYAQQTVRINTTDAAASLIGGEHRPAPTAIPSTHAPARAAGAS